MSNSFIGHGDDPTLPINPANMPDVNKANLEKYLAGLSEKDREVLFCYVNGYNTVPVSIEQLYSDTYYLGNEHFFNEGRSLYDFWKGELKKIYPDRVSSSAFYLVLTGAIGIGKSTVSRLMLAMTYHRLLCMKNPSLTLGLAPKPFSAVIMHRSEQTASMEFKKWFTEDIMTYSPYFRNNKPTAFKFKLITSGPRGAAGLGSDVLYYLLGEINFWPTNDEKTRSVAATALGRFSSRFNKDALQKVGAFILDSSAAGDNGPTEWFLENSDPNYTYTSSPSHWEVKKSSYKESNGQTFPVYIGDGKYPPCILPADYRLADDQDPDRVLNVPIQLKQEAIIDLNKLIMDKGGRTTTSSDAFFGGNISHMVNCMKNYKNLVPEILTVDFYDKTDRLYDKIKPAMGLCALGSTVWIGLDLATTSDMASVSAVCFDGWEIINTVKMPKVRCLFCVAVGRKDGQQTSLYHFEDLIFEMKKWWNIIVSADQAYSKQILQDLERESIPTQYISTDNSPSEPALYLKNLINNESIKIPENRRLQREAYDLRYAHTNTGKVKIDHPKRATQNPTLFDVNNGVGSKDCWDSLSSACYSLKLSCDAGEEYGTNSGYTRTMLATQNITKSAFEETQKTFQGMLENLF